MPSDQPLRSSLLPPEARFRVLVVLGAERPDPWTPERRRRLGEAARAGQLRAWRDDPLGRRRAVTIGHVRALLRDSPDDLGAVVVAAAEAAAEGQKAAS